tara:strand:- start:44 stop:466 length:423 start_codon:yes stop_codon:yes gene_type:complete
MFLTGQEITDNYQPLGGDRGASLDAEEGYEKITGPAWHWGTDMDEYSEYGEPTGTRQALYRQTDEGVWGDKLEESQGGRESLYDSIDRSGVEQPVTLTLNPVEGPHRQFAPEVAEGHHRIAVARALGPDKLVPVEYEEYA